MENWLPAALTQGGYYFLTGIWSILSIGTFQKVTGPKHDLWLVKTVGVVLSVIGAALIVAGSRGELVPSMVVLAIGTAAGLAVIEVIYAKKRIISPIYLLDAVAELLFIAWWIKNLL